MSDVHAFLEEKKWPLGFEGPILDVADKVAFRYVVVDNSRSMMKRDHEIVPDDYKGAKA